MLEEETMHFVAITKDEKFVGILAGADSYRDAVAVRRKYRRQFHHGGANHHLRIYVQEESGRFVPANKERAA